MECFLAAVRHRMGANLSDQRQRMGWVEQAALRARKKILGEYRTHPD